MLALSLACSLPKQRKIEEMLTRRKLQGKEEEGKLSVVQKKTESLKKQGTDDEKNRSVWLVNYSESREKKRHKHTPLNVQGKEERKK